MYNDYTTPAERRLYNQSQSERQREQHKTLIFLLAVAITFYAIILWPTNPAPAAPTAAAESL